MIVADLTKATLEEVVVEKDSALDKELAAKVGPGFSLTYPALEIESEGVLLTQAPAIVEYLVELGSA